MYPSQLCRAVPKGCVSQFKKDGKTAEHVHRIQECSEQELNDPGEIMVMNGMKLAKVFRDAVSGQPLEEALVRAARARRCT